MAEEWLTRRLRLVDEPVTPDPEFADALYRTLLGELRLDVPSRLRRPEPSGEKTTSQSRWSKLVLVAAFLVAAAVAGVSGVGGLIRHGQIDTAPAAAAPPVCELITSSEIAAIVGFPVTLVVPQSGVTWSTQACTYEYDAESHPNNGIPNVSISIARYADGESARLQVGPGIGDERSIPDLGDAAALYYNPPVRSLSVLRGTDVLSVGAILSGVFNPLTPDQMEAIARVILARL